MAEVHPVRWLTEQAKTGLKELPDNARWLMSRAEERADDVGDSTGDLTSRARSKARQLKESVVEATPIGGDSVEARLRSARDASERARKRRTGARARP